MLPPESWVQRFPSIELSAYASLKNLRASSLDAWASYLSSFHAFLP
jgi:hypothetical protein